jgi:hypothetical protein
MYWFHNNNVNCWDKFNIQQRQQKTVAIIGCLIGSRNCLHFASNCVHPSFVGGVHVAYICLINVLPYYVLRRRPTKQTHNAICVRHHYAQTCTNNVNNIWVFYKQLGVQTNRISFCFVFAEIVTLRYSLTYIVVFLWDCSFSRIFVLLRALCVRLDNLPIIFFSLNNNLHKLWIFNGYLMTYTK